MLTIDSRVKIPSHVSFSCVENDTFLLNTQTNQYFRLDEAGTLIWDHLERSSSLKIAAQYLMEEFEIDPLTAEQDILDLISELEDKGLVEILPA